MGITKRGRVYYADYYDAQGDRQRPSLGVTSRRAAEQLYGDLLASVQRERLGLPALPRRAAPRPLAAQLADYLSHLQAHGGRGGGPAHPRHVQDVRAILERFVEARRLVYLSQVTIDEARTWLREEAAREPRRPRKQATVSARTLQRSASALKAWSRWLFEQKRIPSHVLYGLTHVVSTPEQLDRRHTRRPLTEKEFSVVLEAAGAYRATIYLVMARTGLRVEEVARLRWRDVAGLGTKRAILKLRASATKNKRGGSQPLPASAAAAIKDWRDGKLELGIYERYAQVAEPAQGLDDPVFPMVPKLKTWKKDLREAKVVYETAEGKADLHSLRVKYGTDLINAGHPPQVVMDLMRHSSIKLTLELYAFASDEQRRAAVEALGGAA